MGSFPAQPANLNDPSRLHKIDKLREISISEYVPLPQVISVSQNNDMID